MKIVISLASSFLICFLVSTPCNGQAPHRLSYSAAVIRNGTNYSGTAKFKFAFISAGGNETLWSNDGKSIGGGEPLGAIESEVQKGMVGITLGEAMAPLPASLPERQDLRLRVWIDFGEGFQRLAPDQQLSSVIWAFQAEMARSVSENAIASKHLQNSSVVADKIADGSVTAGKLAPDLWNELVHAKMSALWTPDGSEPLFRLDSTAAYLGSRTRSGSLMITGAIGVNGAIELGDSSVDGINGAFIDFHGGFGRPEEDFNVRLKNDSDGYLTIVGGLRMTGSSRLHAIELGDSSVRGLNSSYLDFHGGFGRPDEDFNVRLKNDNDGMLTVQRGGLRVERDMNVGGNINMTLGQNFFFGSGMLGSGRSADGLNEGAYLELRGRGYGQYIDFANDTGTDFDARLALSGDDLLSLHGATLEVPALKIVGGADIAERFSAKSGSSEIQPGMVVRYARDGSQEIELCDEAVDRAVAGVISDAGGINSGLVLEQAGTAASGNHKVAMLGRVQVWADANYGAIRVGDALVSSQTPGHAMRSENPSQAAGAVIGKATSNLEIGRGLIWMHVSLK